MIKQKTIGRSAILALIALLASGCSTIKSEYDDIMGTNTYKSSSDVPHVAVIDDMDTTRYAVIARLPQTRIKVSQYQSAAAFLLEFKTNDFALIVCDHQLGEGPDGDYVLREVRQKSAKRIPFVLVSAFSTDAEMQPFIDAGADRVLSKTHLDDLRGIANELLGFH